jgi:hypothetical protein
MHTFIHSYMIIFLWPTTTTQLHNIAYHELLWQLHCDSFFLSSLINVPIFTYHPIPASIAGWLASHHIYIYHHCHSSHPFWLLPVLLVSSLVGWLGMSFSVYLCQLQLQSCCRWAGVGGGVPKLICNKSGRYKNLRERERETHTHTHTKILSSEENSCSSSSSRLHTKQVLEALECSQEPAEMGPETETGIIWLREYLPVCTGLFDWEREYLPVCTGFFDWAPGYHLHRPPLLETHYDSVVDLTQIECVMDELQRSHLGNPS